MPLVRIDLAKGKPAAHRRAIGDIIYKAMREVIDVPEHDKFQVITEHPAENLNCTSSYLGISYSPDIILIQITLSAGRTVETKKAFYKRIVDDLHAQLKIRREEFSSTSSR